MQRKKHDEGERETAGKGSRDEMTANRGIHFCTALHCTALLLSGPLLCLMLLVLFIVILYLATNYRVIYCTTQLFAAI